MEVSSKHQLTVFLICMLSGMCCALFFDIQRSLRRLHSAGKFRTTAEDIVFAVVVTSVLIALGFYYNRGQMRYYQVMGAISGALFYAAFLSRIAMRVMVGTGKIFVKFFICPIVKTIEFTIRPFVVLYNFIKLKTSRIKRVKNRIFRYVEKQISALKKRMKML